VTPEEALERARGTSFGEDLSGFSIEPTDELTPDRLMKWAVIEPDIELVRSTRWYGAPITWVKRLLRHLLRQELDQAYAQQTRFNLMVVTRLEQLDAKIDEGPPGP